MQRTGLYVLLAFLLFAVVFPTLAQDGDNLLTDGDFEGSYSGRGSGDLNIPDGWNIWYAESPRTEVWMNLRPVGFPHNGPDPDPQSGRRAINLNKGFATFTAAVYQQVGVSEGANVEARAYAYLHTCNIAPDNDKCGSAVESGALTKIGIDPNGGTNPFDGDVVWSQEYRPHDRWDEMTVSATATGGTVTVFLYVTQASPSELNKVYFDNARMRVGGEGGSAPAGGGGSAENNAPPPTPVPSTVGFVTAQEAREDGSIVHRVMSGDTIDSIAVAYGVTRQDILALNNISDPRIISIGQELIIREGDGSGDGGGRSGRSSNDEEEPDGESTEEASAAAAGDDAPPDEGEEPVADEGEEGGDEEAGDEGEGEGEEEEARPPQESAAPAPVVAVPTLNALPTTSTVCVLMFDDINQNRLQEPDEPSLAGGQVRLTLNGETANEFETASEAAPHCVESLAPGEYLTIATAPNGYGLTTPNQLRVRAAAGATINVMFGAAQGVVPAMVPPPDDVTVEEPKVQERVVTPDNPLMENSGLIVLGLAGVVLIIGTGATLVMRRR